MRLTYSLFDLFVLYKFKGKTIYVYLSEAKNMPFHLAPDLA